MIIEESRLITPKMLKGYKGYNEAPDEVKTYITSMPEEGTKWQDILLLKDYAVTGYVMMAVLNAKESDESTSLDDIAIAQCHADALLLLERIEDVTRIRDTTTNAKEVESLTAYRAALLRALDAITPLASIPPRKLVVMRNKDNGKMHAKSLDGKNAFGIKPFNTTNGAIEVREGSYLPVKPSEAIKEMRARNGLTNSGRFRKVSEEYTGVGSILTDRWGNEYTVKRLYNNQALGVIVRLVKERVRVGGTGEPLGEAGDYITLYPQQVDDPFEMAVYSTQLL